MKVLKANLDSIIWNTTKMFIFIESFAILFFLGSFSEFLEFLIQVTQNKNINFCINPICFISKKKEEGYMVLTLMNALLDKEDDEPAGFLSGKQF